MINKEQKDDLFKKFMLESVDNKIHDIDSQLKFNAKHINSISVQSSLLKKQKAELNRYRKQIEEMK